MCPSESTHVSVCRTLKNFIIKQINKYYKCECSPKIKIKPKRIHWSFKAVTLFKPITSVTTFGYFNDMIRVAVADAGAASPRCHCRQLNMFLGWPF